MERGGAEDEAKLQIATRDVWHTFTVVIPDRSYFSSWANQEPLPDGYRILMSGKWHVGRDFDARVLEGNEWLREQPIFWEHEGNRAIRVGDWKLVAQGKQ